MRSIKALSAVTLSLALAACDMAPRAAAKSPVAKPLAVHSPEFGRWRNHSSGTGPRADMIECSGCADSAAAMAPCSGHGTLEKWRTTLHAPSTRMESMARCWCSGRGGEKVSLRCCSTRTGTATMTLSTCSRAPPCDVTTSLRDGVRRRLALALSSSSFSAAAVAMVATGQLNRSSIPCASGAHSRPRPPGVPAPRPGSAGSSGSTQNGSAQAHPVVASNPDAFSSDLDRT